MTIGYDDSALEIKPKTSVIFINKFALSNGIPEIVPKKTSKFNQIKI